MTVRRGVVIIVQAAFAGLLVAIALSGDALISAQVWLAAAALAVVAILVRELVSVAGVERVELVAAWTRHTPSQRASGPRGLLAIKALLSSAQNNPRIHAQQLRPRLVELAAHYLPIRHGIDLQRDPDRVADLLGDSAWLIDESVTNRMPSPADIDGFLDVLLTRPVGDLARIANEVGAT